MLNSHKSNITSEQEKNGNTQPAVIDKSLWAGTGVTQQLLTDCEYSKTLSPGFLT
jgi:hypothetical protein